MCGRFTRGESIDVIAEEFGIGEILTDLQPSFNIAPTQNIVAVVNDGEKKLVTMRWGLVPSWAKDLSIGSKMINARAETLTEKASFKNLIRKRRCLIVADGFYEWKAQGGEKTPYYIQLKTPKLFAFAGLYDRWLSPEVGELTTCTIITTEANEFMQRLHHRMPVILTDAEREAWLDTSLEDKADILEVLKPYDSQAFKAHAVSKQVNSPTNNSPKLILPGAASS
jgi:putative SOS response-associated peptidase YedK